MHWCESEYEARQDGRPPSTEKNPGRDCRSGGVQNWADDYQNIETSDWTKEPGYRRVDRQSPKQQVGVEQRVTHAEEPEPFEKPMRSLKRLVRSHSSV